MVVAVAIALLTPYELPMHGMVKSFFAGEGFTVVADATFNLGRDRVIAGLDRGSIIEASESLVTARPDALYVSCTGMPLVPYLQEVEDLVGVPVITSAQSMAWHCLEILGYGKAVAGFGMLLRQLGNRPPMDGIQA